LEGEFEALQAAGAGRVELGHQLGPELRLFAGEGLEHVQRVGGDGERDQQRDRGRQQRDQPIGRRASGDFGGAAVVGGLVAAGELRLAPGSRDGVCDVNPFKGVRVRASDPRALKQLRSPRVWSWDQMHAFAAAAGAWEPMIRTLADCGLRIGELLALERGGVGFDAATLTVAGTAWNGPVVASSREKRHDRIVPVLQGVCAVKGDGHTAAFAVAVPHPDRVALAL